MISKKEIKKSLKLTTLELLVSSSPINGPVTSRSATSLRSQSPKVNQPGPARSNSTNKERPAGKQPVAKQPATSLPAVKQPVAKQLATSLPVVSRPVASPSAKKSSTMRGGTKSTSSSATGEFKGGKYIKRSNYKKKKRERLVALVPRKNTVNFSGTVTSLQALPKEIIDYKNVILLRNSITAEGKIFPRRFTKLNAKQQRYISKAIKNARMVGLLPFIKKSK